MNGCVGPSWWSITLPCYRHVRQVLQAAEAHVVSMQQAVQLSL